MEVKKGRKHYTEKEKLIMIKGLEFYTRSELENLTGISSNLFYKWKALGCKSKSRKGR